MLLLLSVTVLLTRSGYFLPTRSTPPYIQPLPLLHHHPYLLLERCFSTDSFHTLFLPSQLIFIFAEHTTRITSSVYPSTRCTRSLFSNHFNKQPTLTLTHYYWSTGECFVTVVFAKEISSLIFSVLALQSLHSVLLSEIWLNCYFKYIGNAVDDRVVVKLDFLCYYNIKTFLI